MSDKPLASICCITAQHGDFLSDAISGFVRQRTQFPLEVLIGVDKSTDGTLDVALEYQARYPDVIRVLAPEETRLGVQRNEARVLAAARGRYIALCEGDDYWADDSRLQTQVEFLEAEPEYALCYGSAIAIRDGTEVPGYQGGLKKDVSALEMKVGCSLNSMTVVFRNQLAELPPEYFVARLPDVFLWALLSQLGPGKYLSCLKPAVYRVHKGGIYSGQPVEKRQRMSLITTNTLFAYFDRTGDIEAAEALQQKTMRIAMSWLCSSQGIAFVFNHFRNRLLS